MNLSDFKFDLPKSLIANSPVEPRDECKLLVVNRSNNTLGHCYFFELAEFLREGDVLVLNDTKVFPARLYGKKDSGGKVEVLLLRQVNIDAFVCLGRGKLKQNQIINFDEDLTAIVVAKNEDGDLTLKFNKQSLELLQIFEKIGHTPLPPYIQNNSSEKLVRDQYQTVYARENGSAAAPTAGLHFTQKLLKKLEKSKIQIEKVTLHVGLGTFKPVTAEQIVEKKLHSEWYEIDDKVAQRLNQAKQDGRRIIAVGTTSCRVLETATDVNGVIHGQSGETDIFIQPGYKFKTVQGLITNFHLPETSLLMLVTTFVSSPNTSTKYENFSNSLIGKAYQTAIENKYRFFSFGDSMIIL